MAWPIASLNYASPFSMTRLWSMKRQRNLHLYYFKFQYISTYFYALLYAKYSSLKIKVYLSSSGYCCYLLELPFFHYVPSLDLMRTSLYWTVLGTLLWLLWPHKAWKWLTIFLDFCWREHFFSIHIFIFECPSLCLGLSLNSHLLLQKTCSLSSWDRESKLSA